jgi:hypothetical protein
VVGEAPGADGAAPAARQCTTHVNAPDRRVVALRDLDTGRCGRPPIGHRRGVVHADRTAHGITVSARRERSTRSSRHTAGAWRSGPGGHSPRHAGDGDGCGGVQPDGKGNRLLVVEHQRWEALRPRPVGSRRRPRGAPAPGSPAPAAGRRRAAACPFPQPVHVAPGVPTDTSTSRSASLRSRPVTAAPAAGTAAQRPRACVRHGPSLLAPRSGRSNPLFVTSSRSSHEREADP